MTLVLEAYGFDDVPAEEDLLSISSYINGLVKFINKCPSPMTVAVQGSWGTGKTSAMLQIKRKLDDPSSRIKTIFFNTWQYSQFDLGENLAISMLKVIADGMTQGTTGEEAKKFAPFLSSIRKMGKLYAVNLIPAAAELVGGGIAGTVVRAAVATGTDMVSQGQEPDELDGVAVLSSLREEFAAAVKESGRRLVVFIDDLDRLAPGRAIEVMEAIKVFLDVPDCVFVLAIDFDVVKMGVQEKYGKDVSERKARSFFDKIIQVPFHMPVARYEMTTFFTQGLKRAGIDAGAEKLGDYLQLSEVSVGSNPRSTKRLLNTFMLLISILDSTDSGQSESGAQADAYLDLFAVLCLQTAFPEAYSALGEKNVNSDPAEEFIRVFEGGDDGKGNDDGKYTKWGIPESEIALLERFLQEMNRAFTHGTKFSEEAFNKAFSQSTITSVAAGSVTESSFERTFDAAKKRTNALCKSSPELVDLAFQFEREFSGRDDAFVAGANPLEWTVRLTPKGKRLGVLSIRSKSLRLVVELKNGITLGSTPEQMAGGIHAALVEALGAVSGSDHLVGPTIREPATRDGKYFYVTVEKITAAEQVTLIAQALRPYYPQEITA
ncbi:KAP family P-loop NTPase fold protein [Arthrobacter psychrochitiniphilus]|uniref:KAP family P-loop NTPase fold protein n=1 Tax=Arthrobacter psychrochitiniphilus TaxID=291045 RepID=UPI003F7CBA6B